MSSDVLGFLAIDLVLTSKEIGLFWLEPLGLLEDLPSNEQDNEERDSEVSGDEGLAIKFSSFLDLVVSEKREASEECNEAGEDESSN